MSGNIYLWLVGNFFGRWHDKNIYGYGGKTNWGVLEDFGVGCQTFLGGGWQKNGR